jgi:hypothetical protein
MCTFTLCGMPELFREVTGCVTDIQSDAELCISVSLINTHTGFTCDYSLVDSVMMKYVTV